MTRSVVAIILVIMASVGYFAFRPAALPDSRPVPLAIMPMNYPADELVSRSTTALALQLVAELTQNKQLSVVGPTTTIQFADEVAVMQAVAEIPVTLIINGRFVQQDEGVRLLAELIRTSDGAHIWTHWFDCPLDPVSASIIIQAAVDEFLVTNSAPDRRSD